LKESPSTKAAPKEQQFNNHLDSFFSSLLTEIGDLGQRLESRPGKVVPLETVDTQGLEAGEFLRGLDTLGDGPDRQITTYLQYSFYDRLAGPVGINVPYQLQIQFDEIGIELSQQIQTRITGAELIYGSAKTALTLMVADIAKVLFVLDIFAFGHFEDNPVNGEAVFIRCCQGGPDAQFRAIYGIGHEVNAQLAIHAEA